MQNIMLITGDKAKEFADLRELLDYVILQMKGNTEAKAKAETKGDKALKEILTPESPKAEPELKQGEVNSFDLPPMRKPFFGGKDKGEMLSFSYTVNGQSPSKRPADTCRILFTKTKAFATMPPKERDKVVNWGLSFLKKQVRETGKPATCETQMIEAYSMDRFSFLTGATVVFKVSIKKD